MQLAVASLIFVTLLVLAVRFVLGRRWLMVIVTGNSMAPTFRDGQRVLALRRRATRALAVGDVVVFSVRQPNTLALRIKRVAALAGEPVPAWASGLGSVVPDAHVVVSGDNPVSQDSRQLGFVPEASVLAVVGA